MPLIGTVMLLFCLDLAAIAVILASRWGQPKPTKQPSLTGFYMGRGRYLPF